MLEIPTLVSIVTIIALFFITIIWSKETFVNVMIKLFFLGLSISNLMILLVNIGVFVIK